MRSGRAIVVSARCRRKEGTEACPPYGYWYIGQYQYRYQYPYGGQSPTIQLPV